jgi:molecular chaperone DnaJ
MSRNHYQILQIHPQATQAEIKDAYRQLAKQFHPDVYDTGDGHERIVEINAAYEILGDRKRRQSYDQQLLDVSSPDRSGWQSQQERVHQAQDHYRQQRQTQEDADLNLKQWIKLVYQPVCRTILQILKPLKQEIRDLSADPFDDELMADFQAYLETCKAKFQQAQTCLRSRANPSRVAGVAAHLYYAMNHISDALEELETFTLSYDEHCLHTGHELFRMANRLRLETQDMLKQVH